MNLGKTIKLLRISVGLKQRELANKLGISSNYLSLIESNKREPSLNLLKSLSKELNIPMDLFFWDSSEKVAHFTNDQRAIYNSLKDLVFKFHKLRTEATKD